MKLHGGAVKQLTIQTFPFQALITEAICNLSRRFTLLRITQLERYVEFSLHHLFIYFISDVALLDYINGVNRFHRSLISIFYS